MLIIDTYINGDVRKLRVENEAGRRRRCLEWIKRQDGRSPADIAVAAAAAPATAVQVRCERTINHDEQRPFTELRRLAKHQELCHTTLRGQNNNYTPDSLPYLARHDAVLNYVGVVVEIKHSQ